MFAEACQKSSLAKQVQVEEITQYNINDPFKHIRPSKWLKYEEQRQANLFRKIASAVDATTLTEDALIVFKERVAEKNDFKLLKALLRCKMPRHGNGCLYAPAFEDFLLHKRYYS